MKKRNRVLALTVAAAMSASLLAGCGSSAQQGGAASNEAASTDTAASVSDGGEDNIIRVGVVCSMTGGSAIYGEGAHNAVDMAVEKINAGDSGYKIEIVNAASLTRTRARWRHCSQKTRALPRWPSSTQKMMTTPTV